MKKLFAMALALLMVAVLLPVTAMAATIEVSTPEALESAITTAADGTTIQLQQNITMQNGIEINRPNVVLTLDLNGKQYTVKVGSNVNYRGFKITAGTLNVIDSSAEKSGMMIAEGSGTTESNGTGAYGVFRVEAAGTLNLTGIKLKNSRPWGLNVKVLGGKATLEGVTITSEYGGGLEVTEANLGAHSQAGTATVRNCTFKQTGYYDHASSALAVSGGSTLIVEGGTYTSEGTALYVFSSGGNIIVKDGIFSGEKQVVRAEIDTGTYPNYTGSVQLQGGAFSGTYTITSPAAMAVTGGSYDTDPSAYTESSTVVIKDNNEKYHIGKTAEEVMQQGGTFTVVQGDALHNVPGGVTIINGTDTPITVNGITVAAGESKTISIVIIVPDDSTDTTTTTEKPANPATGANDFVGAAAALAVVSLLGMAVASRKK